jgi:hypothetical protein
MPSEVDTEAAVHKVAINTWSSEAVPAASTDSSERDGLNTSNDIFSDAKTFEYYIALYDKAKYECRHLLDPGLEWTREEETKLVRKLDWHVCLWAVCL